MEPDWKSLYAELMLAYEACIDDLISFGVFSPKAFTLLQKHFALLRSYKHTLEDNDNGLG